LLSSLNITCVFGLCYFIGLQERTALLQMISCSCNLLIIYVSVFIWIQVALFIQFSVVQFIDQESYFILFLTHFQIMKVNFYSDWSFCTKNWAVSSDSWQVVDIWCVFLKNHLWGILLDVTCTPVWNTSLHMSQFMLLVDDYVSISLFWIDSPISYFITFFNSI